MGKRALRSLSLSYLSLGMTPTIKLYSAAFRLYPVVSVIPKEELAGYPGPARQSFFWYDNDKDLKARVSHAFQFQDAIRKMNVT